MFNDKPLIRSIILLLAGIELFSVASGSLVFWIAGSRAAWLVLALAALVMAATLFAGIYLYSRYRRMPATQKKKHLASQKRKIQKEIQAAGSRAALIRQARPEIRREQGSLAAGRQPGEVEAIDEALLENLKRLEGKIQDRLEPYSQATFLGYLQETLGLGGPNSRRSNRRMAAGLIGLAVLCPLVQAGLGAAAAVSLFNTAPLPSIGAARVAADLPLLSTAAPTATFIQAPPLTYTPTSTPTLPPTASLTPTSTSSPPATPTPTGTPSSTATPTQSAWACIPQDTLRQAARVVRVIDGDTIEVRLDDKKKHRVRYIGIDTPDQGDPNFWDAMNKNSQLVDGKDVILIKDVSETDRYGRLLRYVLVGDIFVNAEMVASGYAQVSTYPPDVACAKAFARSQDLAMENEAGMWGAAPTPLPSPGPEREGCDPAYPDVCIPSPPPDLDCGQIEHRRFRVLSPDPHRFDGDGDGIGCEG